EVVLTRTPTERGADPGSLSSALPPGLPATVVDDPVAALSGLAADRRRDHEPILVAGSLYLVGAVRAKALELSKQSGA
ncbi:MAG: bifunctional folylpolyglutamate synthase/dihydrofolate synthase, partial [Deltaproteobacteria bacterium]|nr:bifunctional folylpolyglutamate synthase/dihydrofolate synthase [Deltaproteobacteria bacterium]